MIYFGVFGHFCCRNFELDEDFSIELSFGKKYCSLYHDKACVSSDTFTVLSFYLALFFTSRYLYALYPIDTRFQTSLHLTAFVLVHCKYSTRLWLLTQGFVEFEADSVDRPQEVSSLCVSECSIIGHRGIMNTISNYCQGQCQPRYLYPLKKWA